MTPRSLSTTPCRVTQPLGAREREADREAYGEAEAERVRVRACVRLSKHLVSVSSVMRRRIHVSYEEEDTCVICGYMWLSEHLVSVPTVTLSAHTGGGAERVYWAIALC